MMDDVYTNRSDNFTDSDYDNFSDSDYIIVESRIESIQVVVEYIVIVIGLPLALLAIVAVFFVARKDHGAPVYIINLLISDIIQLCCMVARRIDEINFIIGEIHEFGLLASVGFMVCISLERYLVVTKPLWYRFRRDIKVSLGVCVVIWTLPLVSVLPYHFDVYYELSRAVSSIFILLPLPLFIFFLVGTLKALSAARSVPDDEKRRIVSILVAVLLIYTLLFLPSAILDLVEEARNTKILFHLTVILLDISPLADLTLYIFIRKGAIDDLLKSLCCKMSNRQETENTNNKVYYRSRTETV